MSARAAAGFRAMGWKVEQLLVMAYAGEAVERPAATAEVGAGELEPIWAEGIRGSRGVPDEETVRQLVAAQLGRQKGVDVRYFAAVADGSIASYCELFSRGATGQIESVMTLESARGRGHGRAVVTRALAESVAVGHDLTFLLADASDWPKELYRKLGFEEVGSIWDFILEPA
jgi:ribosomal protein S18 acetylase RimI-like enzyme